MDERPEEGLDVGDHADSLEAAAVAEFDHGRWVYVHADYLYPGGEEVADGDGMEHRGDHEAERNVADGFAHLALGFECVGDDVGKGAVVADAAGKDEIDFVADAFEHDAGFDDTLVDG